MNTWCTRISYFDTAADLHDDLLVQQVYEGLELFQALLVGDGEDAIANHPAAQMWVMHPTALAAYTTALATEAVTRGFDLTRQALQITTTLREVRRHEGLLFELPPWSEDTDVLRSHRSNLVRRWPDEYSAKWRGTPERWPYLFPFVNDEGGYDIMVSKAEREMLTTGQRQLPDNIRKLVANL